MKLLLKLQLCLLLKEFLLLHYYTYSNQNNNLIIIILHFQYHTLEKQTQILTNLYDRLTLYHCMRMLFKIKIILRQRIPNQEELTHLSKFVSDAEIQELTQNNLAKTLQEYWLKFLKNSNFIYNLNSQMTFVMIMIRL
ncbi:unnamed protein product [Paramecium sonneborni]|uniref:Transmembrane protein n=1 Tax=Paramecium sonneborni TaxID=65129 RepID=A0A8S1RPR9_9CILI|nr:unnamed protein product [Paramecium sonneborni]